MSERDASIKDLAGLTVDDFSSLIGQAFPVAGGHPLALTLVEAKPLQGGAPGGRQPFTLLFKGPPAPLLPQAMHPLVHPAHGELPIFIVPLSADATGTTYEAVFS